MIQATPAQVHQQRLARVATVAGWLLFVLSFVLLTGWAFHLPALQSLVPGSIPSKANTAAALMLAAVALLRRNHRDLTVYSVAIFLVGTLTLAEYSFNSSFGIDQFLFRDTNFFAYPGRMSQYVSLGFVLLGLSLLLMRSQRLMLREFSSGLGIMAGALGALAILGHAYDTHSTLNLIRPHSNVAVPTAIGFVLAAIGVQYANPSEGIVRLLHADDAGGVMLRRLLPAGIVISLLLGFTVTNAQKQYRWETGFSLALVAAAVGACLVTIIMLNAAGLEREDLAHRESEQRFRHAANSAPVMIWMSGTDKLCTYFNDPWLRFRGRSMHDEVGNGWVEGVHADDLKSCLAIYVNSFDRREPFQMQYRLRRHDGEYRWILDTGVARFNDEGSFAGYIGSCIDITDRKLAEEALADLEHRLLAAQEEERSRIARELHDDINQRIAVLVWELDALRREVQTAPSGRPHSLAGMIERLTQIGTDIQSISRRLHSSHLEYLGLAPAAEALCRDLREQHDLEIDFTSESIPRSLPEEVSLSLYRVLQEALQNVIKHSGAHRVSVHLAANDGEVKLTVTDDGVGFDPRIVGTRRGLGLISMRERMRLLHAEFALQSEPGRGATLRCRVPLEQAMPPMDLVHSREQT